MNEEDHQRPRVRGPDVYRVKIARESFVVISAPSQPNLPVDLTPAEREVVQLILDGLPNNEIAARRGCAPRTVANQIASIYRKLGVGSRRGLVARLLTRQGGR